MKIERKSTIASCAIVLILLLTILSSTADSQQIENILNGTPVGWTDDIRLTNNFTTDNYHAIGVNGDNLHIVWSSLWFGRQIYYSNSTDGGKTWTPRNMISLNGFNCMNSNIEVDGNNLHVVWDDNDAIDHEIKYRNSTDGGITWNPIKMISMDDGQWSEGAKIAVNNSCIHVIWVDSRHGAESVPANTEIYYNWSLDGGVTWGTEKRLTNAWYASAPVGISVNGSNIHVMFVDERTGTFGLYYIRSTDNGVTWDDGQGSVGDAQLISTNEVLQGAMAINGSNIHAVWVNEQAGPTCRIYYRNSTDNGFSWSTPTLLTGPNDASYAPDVGVWGDDVWVTWNDNRDDGSTPELYYRNSTDGGISWGIDTILTEVDGNSSGVPKIALTGTNINIIWKDERDGNPEIYYKRYPDFPTDTTPPTIDHTPITEAPINQPIEILANITDDFEISNVMLYYENVGDTTYTMVDMVLVLGNWTATIPAQTVTGLVHYFIWANDTSGNNITSPIIGDYAIQITGPPSIEVINPIGDEDWTGGSNHQIEFIASDTEDAPAILDVFLNYTSVSAGGGFIAQIKGDDSPYDWTLPIIDATDVVVNATVIDSDGNKTYDDSPEFTIDSSPPEVVLTNPANNTTGISIFQPIVIQFNEPMNISSVIVNQTNGTDPGCWSWFRNEDKDTITGIHDPWDRGETIEITVQVGYKDDSDPGNANNTDYIFSFTTEINPSPEIIHTNISGLQELGDLIRIYATITDDGEVMNAVLWWQDVDDVWHENYMSKNGDDCEYLIPAQMTVGTVKYQINATDDFGQKNSTMIYEFNIRDLTPPVITHTPVESAVVGEAINITCQITDLGGVDITYMSSGVFFVYRYEGDTDFIFRAMNPEYWFELPAHSVPATIEYYIQASDIYGNDATTNVYSLEILDPDTTSPEILLTTPTGDNIPISTDISIVFNEAVNQTSVESAISISPDVSFSSSWTNDQTLFLSITGNLSYNTTYTITIDTGAKDLAGNTLANDYSWQFSTAEETEIVQHPASNDWGWIVIIILLIAIIMLMLFYQFNKERKEKEEEEK